MKTYCVSFQYLTNTVPYTAQQIIKSKLHLHYSINRFIYSLYAVKPDQYTGRPIMILFIILVTGISISVYLISRTMYCSNNFALLYNIFITK